jgi:Na+/melibiose symporter-like transporter
MNPFTRFAFFTVARDAGFVALAAMLLMLAFSFEPALAFGVGATIALVFSMGLLVRVYFLTEERLERSEVWRALQAEERPPGDDGRRWAKGYLETLLLHFAKDASAFASLLYCSALVMALAAGLAQANTVSLPSHQFVNTEPAYFTLK